MPTQNNTITKQDLNKALEATRRDFKASILSLAQGQQEIKSEMRHNQHIMFGALGVLLVFVISAFIAVILVLAGLLGDVGTLQGLHQSVQSTHATIVK